MNTTRRISKWTPVVLLAAVMLFVPSGQANPENFTVQSATDCKTFKLSDTKGKYVALHFLLKTECPFCLKHTPL